MKTVTLKVVIEVPDNYVMNEPKRMLEDSILNRDSECEISGVSEFPQFKPTEDSDDEFGLVNGDRESEKFYLVNVPGKHGYSFMVKTTLEDEFDILEKCSEMDLFNDEDDVTYASVSEADKYAQELFKEFNYLDR